MYPPRINIDECPPEKGSMVKGNESFEPNINGQYVKLPAKISQNVGMSVKRQVKISDVGRMFDKRQPRKGRSCQFPTTLAGGWNEFLIDNKIGQVLQTTNFKVRNKRFNHNDQRSRWFHVICASHWYLFHPVQVSHHPFQVGTTIGWGLPGHGA